MAPTRNSTSSRDTKNYLKPTFSSWEPHHRRNIIITSQCKQIETNKKCRATEEPRPSDTAERTGSMRYLRAQRRRTYFPVSVIADRTGMEGVRSVYSHLPHGVLYLCNTHLRMQYRSEEVNIGAMMTY